MPLFLSVLTYFPKYGHFIDFTWLLQQKPILQCIFQNFDREREFCKKLPFFLILRAYFYHRKNQKWILGYVKNKYFSTIGMYWQWVIKNYTIGLCNLDGVALWTRSKNKKPNHTLHVRWHVSSEGRNMSWFHFTCNTLLPESGLPN